MKLDELEALPAQRIEDPLAAATDPGAVTKLLASWREGDAGACNALFTLLYRQLQALARRKRRTSSAGETLRTTALVHEAYLKLVDQASARIEDRRHFFALASRVMRQVLVDAGRRRSSRKRGGDAMIVPLEDAAEPGVQPRLDIAELDRALEHLAAVDERLCRVVELRVFGGLTVEEVAALLDSSPRTMKRDWRKGRAFLFSEISLTRAVATR